MFKSFFCIFLVCLTFHLQAEEEEIIVKLSTETSLQPISIIPFLDEGSAFDQGYLNSLQMILAFDLDNNGATYVNKAKISSTVIEDPAQISKWKKANIFYVVKTVFKQESLSATVLSVHSNSLQTINGIQLSGNFSQDRRKIHQLADLIHKALFGAEGIANTKVLYTVKTQHPQSKKWLSDIWESDYDGGNAHQVFSDVGYAVMPIYMPPKAGFTSSMIFYVSYKTGQPKIYMANMKDQLAKRLTLLQGNQLMPAISSQRNKVAFICDVTGNPDLFLQDFDPALGAVGKPRQIYATKQGTQGSPSFNPKGDKIAFVSNKDGSPRIYLLDIPAPNTPLQNIKAQLVSKSTRESSAPSWSPDGKKIAYCSMSNGVRQIWVYDVQQNREYQVTDGPGHKENPTWAPNSLHLMFNSTGRSLNELYMINLNQPKAIKISSGPGEKHFPDWQPRA